MIDWGFILWDMLEKVGAMVIDESPLHVKVVALISMIGVGAYLKISKRIKSKRTPVGACNDDPSHCRLYMVVKQMDLVRKSLIPFKTHIKAVFARDLKELMGRGGQEVDLIIRLHSVTVDAATHDMEHEYRMIFMKNSIPDANSPLADVYYETNYELVYGAFWAYMGDNWIEDFFKLRYDDRRALFDEDRQIYYNRFVAIIKEARGYYT